MNPLMHIKKCPIFNLGRQKMFRCNNYMDEALSSYISQKY